MASSYVECSWFPQAAGGNRIRCFVKQDRLVVRNERQRSPACRSLLPLPCGLGSLDTGRVEAPASVLFDVKAQLLAFHDRFDTGLLKRADMHEHVIGAVSGCDEAKATVAIKEFYCSVFHSFFRINALVETGCSTSIAINMMDECRKFDILRRSKRHAKIIYEEYISYGILKCKFYLFCSVNI